MNYPSNIGFVPITQSLTNTIPAGGKWSVRLAVRRPDMQAPPAGATNVLYQSLLQVADGAGALQLVPVTASGMQTAGPSSVSHPGLWVGTATINQVSQGSDGDNPVPTNTASAFQFRLIVHQGTNGSANLLQHVYVAFKSGSGTNQFGTNVPGNYVLLTGDPRPYSNLYDVIIRRFASAAFGFATNVLMTPINANFGADGAALSAAVILGYDDPTNPFKHLYHPDHDNKDDSYSPLATVTNTVAGYPIVSIADPSSRESFSVLRLIQLQFSGTDPDHLSLPGWQDTMVGGQYSETIYGVHRFPIKIQGTFRLHLAVSTPVLNGGS
jgi:hypothetical protein